MHVKFNEDVFCFNPLNIELNPIRHLLALLGAYRILHVISTRVNICTEKHRTVNVNVQKRVSETEYVHENDLRAIGKNRTQRTPFKCMSCTQGY